jgi:cytoskeleton protein RodZ
MSEMTGAPADVGGASSTTASMGGGNSPGRLLRRAREAQGLPIDALAASLKVSARKIELLEADRFDELPDATFTRALAQTLCRSLKVDAAAVLALLPPATGHRIEQVSEGLNAPFRDRSPRLDALAWGPLLKAAWAPALIFALAAALYYAPAGLLQSGATAAGDLVRAMSPAKSGEGAGSSSSTPVAADAPPAAASDASVASGAVETVFSAPPPPPAGASAASAATASAAGPLELRASAESWIEVKDSRDRVLMSRSLQPGEAVTLDGALPMRVKIGNAAVTEVRFRGTLLDITPMTSENIAKVELK